MRTNGGMIGRKSIYEEDGTEVIELDRTHCFDLGMQHVNFFSGLEKRLSRSGMDLKSFLHEDHLHMKPLLFICGVKCLKDVMSCGKISNRSEISARDVAEEKRLQEFIIGCPEVVGLGVSFNIQLREFSSQVFPKALSTREE